MKSMMMFLTVAVLLAISDPVLSEPSDTAPKMAKTNTLKALKSLKLHQHTGVISSINLNEQKLIIKNRRGEQVFSMIPELQVKKGREKLQQTALEPGMKVTVRYSEQEGKKIARIVKLEKD